MSRPHSSARVAPGDAFVRRTASARLDRRLRDRLGRTLQPLTVALALTLAIGCGSGEPPGEPLSELPLYGGEEHGGHELTPWDRTFIANVTRAAGSREKAAQGVLDLGWQAVRERDPRRAIRRFNQAWLLTPDDPEVFWGLGVALGGKGDIDGAIRYIERATATGPNGAPILCDLAFAYIVRAQEHRGEPAVHDASLERARGLLDQAQDADPGYEVVFSNRALAAFEAGDYDTAWNQVREAMKTGGQSLDPRFIHALSARSPRQ